MPNAPRRLLLIIVVALSLQGLTACDAPPRAPEDAPATGTPATQTPRERPVTTAPEEAATPTEEGLRILVPANIAGGHYLPRSGSPVEAQREAAIRFARSVGMRARLVVVDSFDAAIPALARGDGDLLAANLTVTPARRKLIDFSIPLTHVREQVLVRAGNTAIARPADLAGKRVMASPASTFWRTLQKLREKHPTIELVERPRDLHDEDAVDLMVSGEVDAVVRDSNIAAMYLAYRDDIRVACNLGGRRAIAWGVRKDADSLREALNHWLHVEQLDDAEQQAEAGDLDAIRKRKVLRVLMRNNGASYFLYRGQLMGFEYELAQRFARSLDLRLEVVVPPSQADLFTWLKEGRGDMAVGFLEPREERIAAGFAFSRPYNTALRHLVTAADTGVDSPDDLRGMRVMAPPDSDYWLTAKNLRQRYRFDLVPAPEGLEVEDLLAQVGTGELDATVADAHQLDIEIARGAPLKAAFTIGAERSHAVAVRARHGKLLAAVNAFIRKNHRGVVYNILYKKYFKDRGSIVRLAEGRDEVSRDGRLSPWDDSVRRYAEQYGFDWRLLVAQMYQESRFDPQAKSFAGATGLMQVMPRTARSMGFAKLADPETGIHAGIKYLSWVRDRFDATLPVAERTWFSLAAYNAGAGHVHDAQRLARRKGWDAERWFDHTERAMLLLSKRKYASKARHGYVRGREPVNYVRNIRDRFMAYVELTSDRIALVADAQR